MPGTAKTPKTAKKKMDDYRARMRRAGMRPIQIWVPDVHTSNFAEEARRQSRLVSGHPSEKEVLDFMEAVFDWDGLP